MLSGGWMVLPRAWKEKPVMSYASKPPLLLGAASAQQLTRQLAAPKD